MVRVVRVVCEYGEQWRVKVGLEGIRELERWYREVSE
jgi:hypothetical protein